MGGTGVAFNLFGKDIYWYGIIIATGLIIAIVLGILEAKKRGYISDLVIDFMFLAVPLAVIGARLYYVTFEWPTFANDPISILYIWQGGLAIYGAVIGGVIAAIIFCRWKKLPFGDLMDIAAPGLVLAQAIGRWGNFANQEAFGAKITNEAWQWFPAAVFIDRLQEYHMATFFYESFLNVLVFITLMLYRKKAKFRGNVFAAYVMLYGFVRFIVESLRTDSLYLIRWGTNVSVNDAVVFDGLRISQVLSLLMIIGAIIYFIVMRKRNPLKEAYEGRYSIGYVAQAPEVLNDEDEDVDDEDNDGNDIGILEKTHKAELNNVLGDTEKADAENTDDTKK
jgi:phosphatidylglycerol:prolipoprotein diacylglycerol transferase